VDSNLVAHEEHLRYRWNQYKQTLASIVQHEGSLADFARGYERYGIVTEDVSCAALRLCAEAFEWGEGGARFWQQEQGHCPLQQLHGLPTQVWCDRHRLALRHATAACPAAAPKPGTKQLLLLTSIAALCVLPPAAQGQQVYREWAPGAAEAQIIGDFNGWQGQPMERDDFGTWSIRLPAGAPRAAPADAAPRLAGWAGAAAAQASQRRLASGGVPPCSRRWARVPPERRHHPARQPREDPHAPPGRLVGGPHPRLDQVGHR
jgi:hypothetical protein